MFCMQVLLYKPGKGIYNNSHTSSPPIDLYEIHHIFYTWIIHTHCLQTLTGYYWYIYIVHHHRNNGNFLCWAILDKLQNVTQIQKNDFCSRQWRYCEWENILRDLWNFILKSSWWAKPVEVYSDQIRTLLENTQCYITWEKERKHTKNIQIKQIWTCLVMLATLKYDFHLSKKKRKKPLFFAIFLFVILFCFWNK